jgi:DinB superfamily
MNPEYKKTVERVYQLFRTCPDPNLKESAEGWSVKEILGHLVDSVSNNYQRLVRYIPNGNLGFPPYDQEQNVKRANYQAFDFDQLLALWYNYNKLLLHMLAGIPEGDMGSTTSVGDKPPVALRQSIPDYFAHMENHERQAQKIIAG